MKSSFIIVYSFLETLIIFDFEKEKRKSIEKLLTSHLSIKNNNLLIY